MKEHLFVDIFSRDNLDHQSRELATIAALASIPGLSGQLRFHMKAAMNTGLTENQIKDFIAMLSKNVGKAEAKEAENSLKAILSPKAKKDWVKADNHMAQNSRRNFLKNSFLFWVLPRFTAPQAPVMP